MNQEQSEVLATKTLIILFEKECSDIQMENVKALLNLFIHEKKLAPEEIVISKVHKDAVLLKSTKILEKGFPMVYFIQPQKFMGYHEVATSPKLDESLQYERTKEATRGLMTFFRGCEIIVNPDFVQALRIATNNPESPSSSPLEVGLGSQLVDNTVWGVRWGMDAAWNAFSKYGSPPSSEHLLTYEEDESRTGKSTDVEAIKYNWYGRSQKRIYRFYDDFFDRVDPTGNKDGSELIRATYQYSAISEITTENGTDLILRFRDGRFPDEHIHSPNADRMITLICSRAPWTSPVKVTHNLEMKLSKLKVFTVRVALPDKALVSVTPRWKKDNLAIAYQDDLSWKSLDLETLNPELKQWRASDLVHFPLMYAKNALDIPVGSAAKVKIRVLPKEELERDFYDYSVSPVSYAQANSLRTQYGAFIAEMMNPVGSNSILFVAHINEFNGQWKRENEKLVIVDNKCGAPVVSPDGKFVAFIDESKGMLIIHRLDFLSPTSSAELRSMDIDIDEIIFDVRKKRGTFSRTSLELTRSPNPSQVDAKDPSDAPPE